MRIIFESHLMKNKFIVIITCVAVSLFHAPFTWAFQQPTGTFLEPVYTLFSEEIVAAIGYLAAVIFFSFAGYYTFIGNFFKAVSCCLGAAIFFYAEEMALSVGAIFPF